MYENGPLEFRKRLDAARLSVANARVAGAKLELATALKELGNIERRFPDTQDANQNFAEASTPQEKLPFTPSHFHLYQNSHTPFGRRRYRRGRHRVSSLFWRRGLLA